MPTRFYQNIPAFEPAGASGKKIRVHALDGIRGWAALSVVCYHLFWETFGVISPGYRNPFTASFLDGQLAVSIFFVLSGAALSIPYFSKKGVRSVVELAIKRYPRLVIPIFFLAVIVTAILVLGLNYNVRAGALVLRPGWMGDWLTTPASLWRLLRFSLFDVFVRPDGKESLDPLLWTMTLELAGSFIVFQLLILLTGRRRGWFMVAGLFVLSMLGMALTPVYGMVGCFLTGMILAKLHQSGFFEIFHADKILRRGALAALILLLAVDGVLQSYHLCLWRSPFVSTGLVFAIFASSDAYAFMEAPLSQFLGKISFPLFLVQFPVIVSFTSYLIILAAQHGGLHEASGAIAASSLAVAILAAVVFEPVEGLTKASCKWVLGSAIKLGASLGLGEGAGDAGKERETVKGPSAA